MSRWTYTTDKGKTYNVTPSEDAVLVKLQRATDDIGCPLDTTFREMDAFTDALTHVHDAPPAFRSYPVLSEPVS